MTKARKSCNAFRFIDDLNSINDIYSKEIELELFLELHKSISETHDFIRNKKPRIANVLLKFLNKYQSNFNYVMETGKELLTISLILIKSNNNT